MVRVRHLLGFFSIIFSLWISINALQQTRLVWPGENTQQAVQSLLFGRPVLRVRSCPEEVHASYVTIGPDEKTYPTWHPPVDLVHSCYFDHEHGSDPRSYVGFEESRMPAFGYASALAKVSEPHPGYKVFVANDDLNGRAWMIVLNQDTSRPERAEQRFYSLDWHISTIAGEMLVDLHLMADFGHSTSNCNDQIIVDTETRGGARFRSIPTIECAKINAYEAWSTSIDVAGVFKATPYFEIDNPITAINPNNRSQVVPTCLLRRSKDECRSSATFWSGNRRGVLRPGQNVNNAGDELFYTDPYGRPVEAGETGSIRQFVTHQSWDTRNCCGAEVVFRIQTYSGGVYIAAPREPAGSAEFALVVP